MIGNPNWFDIRKYSGWGLRPKTWQGWIYVFGLIAPLLLFQMIPHMDNKIRISFTAIWMVFILLEAIDITIRIKKDERERLHEAIAERNAAWFITVILALALLYQGMQSALTGQFLLDPLLIVALLGG